MKTGNNFTGSRTGTIGT